MIRNMAKNEENWFLHYEELRAHVAQHGHLPDRHTRMNHWWKYQMKKKKAGTLTEEQERMLQELADSRSTEHTGGRRKNAIE